MSVSSDELDNDETQLLISKLVRLCKTTNDKYPSGTDYRYFCSYPSFNEQSNKLSNNILNLLSKLCNFSNSNNKNNINLSTQNNEYLRWQIISDSADHCIEKVDICLDQIKELKNNQSLHNNNSSKMNNDNNNNSSSSKQKQNRLFSGEINDNNSLELLYPQRVFLDLIDNKRNTPFKPNLINGKTNSSKPYNLELIEDDDNNNKYYVHPYLYEINNIQYKEYQLTHRKEEEYTNINDTSIYWIDSESALSEMCQILSCCNEIGVDLEHHSKYTFSGITCLIQISTRNRDYIIDALALRKYLHIYLNPIFTDSNIIKIFHGAMSDIKWLQRDFSIYVVNLFDTFEAAKLLHLRQKSLKYLLKTYCDIDTNKNLRMTDWRIRPLRPELIDYARKDTHYLLYIFDHLTNLLIERSTKTDNLLIECYKNSEKICLIRYEKPYFNVNGWQYLCQKKGWYFINNKSLNALSKLYEWRDRIGRDLDESIEVVLSNKLLKQIVTHLPQNDIQLLNSKKYHLSIIAKKYYKDILNIINEAINMKEENSIDPIFEVNVNNNNNDNNSRNKKEEENMMDLNMICCSNDGCFDGDNDNDDDDIDIMDIDKDEVCKLDMISMEYNDDNKNASKVSFFPINNFKFDEQDNNAQNIANEIFNEISNEPVLKLIEQTINYQQENKNKKKNKKQHRNNDINKKQREQKSSKQVKLKKNNIDRVANASNRDKIFGSRYVDRNSKKNVFKLPRDNKKKRKAKDVDIDGPILENIKPQKKKRKISKYKQIQEKLKQDRQKKRMEKTTAVDDEWPINKMDDNINQQIIKKKKKNKKNKNKNKNENNNNNNNKAEEEEDIEMTESDILDAAPVPVLDTKFENVYDPLKSNLPS